MREFLSNAILLVLLNLLVKGFYLFGIDRTVQNVLPEGEYGLYFTLFNFAYLFQIIGDMGLQNYNSRQVAQARGQVGKYFSHFLLLKLALGLTYLALVLLGGRIWGYDGRALGLLAVVALNLGLQSLVLYLRSNLGGLGRYRADSVISIADKVILIGLVGLLLWQPGFRLWHFVLAQTAAWTITALLTYILLHPHLRGWRWRWQPHTLLALLRRSAPYALIIFLMTAYTRLDAIMIERLLPDGLAEADIYASAFRLLDAVNMAGFLIAGLLLPMFARQLALREATGALTRLGAGTLGAGAITMAVSAGAFATPIMETLYVNGSAYSGQVMTWLMATFVAMSLGYVYGTLLTAAGELRHMNVFFAAGVLLNLLLNLVFIPPYKALGAAAATCVTQFLMLAAQLWLVRRRLGQSVPRELLLRLLGLLLFCAGQAWFWRSALAPELAWHVKFAASVCIGLLSAFWLGLLDWRQWLSLLRRA